MIRYFSDSEDSVLEEINRMIFTYQSANTMVSFYQLPAKSNSNDVAFPLVNESVIDRIHRVLQNVGPAVLGFGLKNVMTT